MPAPAVVAVIVVPAVAWSARTNTAVPAIAVIVGAWATVVDATVMWTTRTAISTLSTGTAVAWAAWTVIARAIVAAVIASISTGTMVAIARVHIAPTMVASVSTGTMVAIARCHISVTGTVVTATRTSVTTTIIAARTVVAVAGDHASFALVRLVARLIDAIVIVVIAVVLRTARVGVGTLVLIAFVVAAMVSSAAVIAATMVATTTRTVIATARRVRRTVVRIAHTLRAATVAWATGCVWASLRCRCSAAVAATWA